MSFRPRYWLQRIAPPVAIAEKIKTIITFIESTRETAEIAAEPHFVIITVSAVPINEFKSCSTIRGTSS